MSTFGEPVWALSTSAIIPATFHFRPEGTHSWGYWEDEIELSWPQIEQALNS